MRSDAASLLERLGKPSLKYQEFRDNFADMELWPIFEALLQDPRIVGGGPVARQVEPEAADVAPVVRHPAGESVAATGGLFRRYGDAGVPQAPREDVRNMLRRLADRIETGDS